MAEAAAGAIDVGSIAGRVALSDEYSDVADRVASKAENLGQKLDDVGTRGGAAAEHLKSGFVDFESLMERIGERLAVYFTFEHATEFVSSLYDDAEAMQNVAEQTGATTDEVQRLDLVFQRFGVSGEQISRILFMIRERAASGDQSVAAAFSQIGLSLDDVENMDPVDLLEHISDGLGGLSKSAQAAVEAQLGLGRLGPVFAGVAGQLSNLYTEAERNPIIGADAVSKLAEQKADWDVFWKDMKAGVGDVAAELGGPLLQGVPVLGEVFTVWKQSQEAAAKAGQETDHWVVKLNDDEKLAQATFLLQKQATKDLTDIQQKWLDQLKDSNQLTPQAAALMGVNAAQFKKYKEAADEATKTQKEFDKAWKDLENTGVTVDDTLKTINPTLAQIVEQELKAGASSKDLATAYGLTDQQVKALNVDLKSKIELQKQEEAETDKVNKLNRQAAADRASIGSSSLANAKQQIADETKAEHEGIDKQIADIQRRTDITDDAKNREIANLMAESNAFDDAQNAKLDKAEVAGNNLLGINRENLQDQLEQDQTALNDMLYGQKTYSAEVIAEQKKRVEDDKDRIRDWRGTLSQELDKAKSDTTAAAVSQEQDWGKVAIAAEDAADAVKAVADAAEQSFTYDLSTQSGIQQFISMNPGARITGDINKIMKEASGGTTLQQLIAQGLITMPAGQSQIHLAQGGVVSARVGENGPEDVMLPVGAVVTPNRHGLPQINLHVPIQIIGGIVDTHTLDKIGAHVATHISRAAGIAFMR